MMVVARLIVLGDTRPPVKIAKHLDAAGLWDVYAETNDRIPDLRDSALWVSNSGATRLLDLGMELELLSPGPDWILKVPSRLRGRWVICTWLGKLHTLFFGPGTFRFVEQQLGVLGTPKSYPSPEAFARQVKNTQPDDSDLYLEAWVIASEPVTYVDR